MLVRKAHACLSLQAQHTCRGPHAVQLTRCISDRLLTGAVRLRRAKHETDKMAEHQEQSLCGYELEAVIRRMSACCAEKTVCTFCIDGSGSVTPNDFRVMTSFVATAMESLTQTHPHCKVLAGRSGRAWDTLQQPAARRLKSLSLRSSMALHVNVYRCMAMVHAESSRKVSDLRLYGCRCQWCNSATMCALSCHPSSCLWTSSGLSWGRW